MLSKIKGFTLLETLVAIAILSLAMVGPLELASRAIGSAMTSQNQITAFYLAQEAIEFIRNKRDNNLIAGIPGNWIVGNDLNLCAGDGCGIDVPNNTLVPCTPGCGNIDNLLYDAGGNYYNTLTGSETTIFKRTALIANINASEAKIEVTVSWNDKARSKSIVLQENLYEWR